MNTVSVDPLASASSMLLDHPGWFKDDSGRVRRAFRSGGETWTAVSDSTNIAFASASDAVRSISSMRSLVDSFDLTALPGFFCTAKPIADGRCVQRLRNPDLWDALLIPVFRQRRRADDAARMYRRFCINHGNVIETKAGLALLPPTPETVITLPDESFIKLKMRDKRQPLRVVAEAYLKQAGDWENLSTFELLTELQTVSYVGAWTAGATVADITNNYSFCPPPVDVAYRRWHDLHVANTVAISEQTFAEAWAALTDKQLSTLTLLLLASPGQQRRPRTGV
jgi:DNA-3-methyladenine glycosylase II